LLSATMYWSPGKPHLLGNRQSILDFVDVLSISARYRDGYSEQWVAAARKVMNGVKACKMRCWVRRAKLE
jgi:hypothetical protein